ncbi:S-locus lectin protein kinase family protein, partial [Striga asiatica]
MRGFLLFEKQTGNLQETNFRLPLDKFLAQLRLRVTPTARQEGGAAGILVRVDADLTPPSQNMACISSLARCVDGRRLNSGGMRLLVLRSLSASMDRLTVNLMGFLNFASSR